MEQSYVFNPPYHIPLYPPIYLYTLYPYTFIPFFIDLPHQKSGGSSVGRVSASQAESRGFESRSPLKKTYVNFSTQSNREYKVSQRTIKILCETLYALLLCVEKKLII